MAHPVGSVYNSGFDASGILECSIWEYRILRSLSDLKNAENNFPFYSIDLAH